MTNAQPRRNLWVGEERATRHRNLWALGSPTHARRRPARPHTPRALNLRTEPAFPGFWPTRRDVGANTGAMAPRIISNRTLAWLIQKARVVALQHFLTEPPRGLEPRTYALGVGRQHVDIPRIRSIARELECHEVPLSVTQCRAVGASCSASSFGPICITTYALPLRRLALERDHARANALCHVAQQMACATRVLGCRWLPRPTHLCWVIAFRSIGWPGATSESSLMADGSKPVRVAAQVGAVEPVGCGSGCPKRYP